LVGVSEQLKAIAYSSDGTLLVAAGGTPARFGEVQIWQPEAGKLKKSITLTNDTVFGASISPDSKMIAVGGADNSVRLIDSASGKELQKIVNHENWVLGTTFGVDGKRIVSVGRDRAAKLSDTASGAFLENVNLLRGELLAIARHPSKDLVVIGGEERTPYIYKMDRPKVMKIADDTTLVRKLPRQDGVIATLAWSGDGKSIAVGGGGLAVNVYNADDGKLIASCKGHEAVIYAAAFSPAGDRLATGGFDGHVRIYNAATGELLKDFIPVPLASVVTSRE
jgi:FOG: WD40 repeat